MLSYTSSLVQHSAGVCEFGVFVGYRLLSNSGDLSNTWTEKKGLCCYGVGVGLAWCMVSCVVCGIQLPWSWYNTTLYHTE